VVRRGAIFNMKQMFIVCAILLTGCDYPPGEATKIQKQLESQISKGQIYLMHSADELSFVIKNSEFNKRTEVEQDDLIASVETQALDLLSKYEEFKIIRIYFVGDGSAGIDRPYLCQTVSNACVKAKKNGTS